MPVLILQTVPPRRRWKPFQSRRTRGAPGGEHLSFAPLSYWLESAPWP